jgi:pimeloyl-ACP methyl ester carboxylesterase
MTGIPDAVASKGETSTSFGPLKQTDAGLLNVGYVDAGPADGPAVILLHGWPYDIHSYLDVAPLLAAQGYRVIIPYVRGHGTTRFLSQETFRNGQQSVLAFDVIALMDALEIDKAVVAVGELASTSKDAILSTALVPLHDPVGDGAETAVELGVEPAKFRDVVAADLPGEQTAVMAATQRPIAELAFSEPRGPPAWKSRPAWAVVATGDKAAGADLVRSQAERAGATITELEGSHVIMISQPEAVADVILTAAAAVDRQTAAAGG